MKFLTLQKHSKLTHSGSPNLLNSFCHFVIWMNGWMDGWMGGWMDWIGLDGLDGWMDGWMDGLNGWMDGWIGWMDGSSIYMNNA